MVTHAAKYTFPRKSGVAWLTAVLKANLLKKRLAMFTLNTFPPPHELTCSLLVLDIINILKYVPFPFKMLAIIRAVL